MFVLNLGYCFLVNGVFKERNLEGSREFGDVGVRGKDVRVDSVNCLRCFIR